MCIKLVIKFNNKNTFITIVNTFLNKVLGVYSCGSCGFKGRRKNSPFAVSQLAKKVALKLLSAGYLYCNISFNGINSHRYIIINTLIKTYLKDKNLTLLSIKDTTSVPFNGCRPSKKKSR
uniref:Ribosomal protein S11 n=1 Tax=Apicomplexa sp. corallicolid ex Leiopathes glaberrima TaxID=2720216 RepID=A0A6M3R7I2_9APIC|nr:ribosomal protein S11 [Apicomplexa sp. corallicolid ex Leiopathes glaberrima]